MVKIFVFSDDGGCKMQDTGCWIQDAGYWMLDTGYWISMQLDGFAT